MKEDKRVRNGKIINGIFNDSFSSSLSNSLYEDCRQRICILCSPLQKVLRLHRDESSRVQIDSERNQIGFWLSQYVQGWMWFNKGKNYENGSGKVNYNLKFSFAFACVLAEILIYYRYRSIVAKLILLRISHKVRICVLVYFVKYISYQK